MFCKNCGNEVDDNAVVCPHCGVPVAKENNGYQPQAQSQGNTIAIVGFIFSFFIPLVGLICSIMGYNKAKKEGLPYKGLALAGIIISVVSWALAFILYFTVFAAMLAI